MKKFAGLYLLIGVILICITPLVVSAQGEDLTKTSLYNVAQFKPVTASKAPGASSTLGNLVDDTRTTMTYFGGTPTQTESAVWVQVDLLRRYKIQRIEVMDRYDIDQADTRANFRVLASNSEDFSEYDDLGGMGDPNVTIFPYRGTFTVNVSEGKAYRYVRLQRTVKVYTTVYNELKVYAQQTMTEISRNKPVTTITNSEVLPPSKAVDGLNAEPNDAWVAGTGNYRFLRVDLGKPYHVGSMEVEGRYQPGVDDSAARCNFAFYGSNTIGTDSTNNNTRLLDTFEDYRRLTALFNPYATDTTYNPFPPIATNDPTKETGYYKASCDDTQAYQYITYKRLSNTANTTAVGELRLFVVNPMIVESQFTDNKTIVLGFSDPMEVSMLNEENIKVYSGKNSEPLPYTRVSYDEYSYRIDLGEEMMGEPLQVVVSSKITNKKGIDMGRDVKIPFDTKAAVNVLQFDIINSKNTDGQIIDSLTSEAQAGAKIVLKSNLVSKNEEAVIIAVLYDQNNAMVDACEVRKTIAASSSDTIYTGLDLPEGDLSGYTFAVYIWKNFSQMKPLIGYKSI